ncbi:MAG: DUF1080 domain-containing protein [Planctomycetota bacterium]
MRNAIALSALLSAALLLGYGPTPTPLKADDHASDEATETNQEGWIDLFDGESIESDWQVMSGKATYRVEDGSIVGTTEPGSPNTFLCTKRTFGDFELTFEVLLHDNQLNSGIMIRCLNDENQNQQYGGRIKGPQVEIEAGPGQSGFIYGEASGGWLSPEPKSPDRSVSTHDHFKNGVWNEYRIVAQGPRIQTWLNGEMIADLTVSDRYQEQYAEGMIGLQVHGVGNRGPFTVRWRNLKLRELPAE